LKFRVATEGPEVTENTARPLRVERNPAPVRTQVIDNLRQAIIDRRFLPGQRLIERELVELTGVSRTSIREALRELTAEGLVTSVPNKGNVVTEVSAKEAVQLYQVRSALEGLAGRIFVHNASAKDRYALAKAMQDIERAASAGQSMLEAKDHFYDILFAGGGNDALRLIASSLHARISVLRSLSLSLPGRAPQTLAELHSILTAIEANDADAAADACAWHVEAAGRAAIEALADGQAPGGS
jgi:GntR family transcriptional regulator, trigonelline degradation regulator